MAFLYMLSFLIQDKKETTMMEEEQSLVIESCSLGRALGKGNNY